MGGIDDGWAAQATLLKSFFTRLWNLNIACKIIIAMWKIANNYIPILTSLQNRRIVVQSQSPIYRPVKETVEHIFVNVFFS